MTKGPQRVGSFMLAAAGSASLLEVAPLFAVLRDSQPLTVILLLGLAYQLGNGAARHVGRSPVLLAALGILGLAAWLLSSGVVVVQMAAVAAMSASLQAVRRALAHSGPKIPTAKKRAYRVAGFVLAAVLPASIALSLAVVVCVLGARLLALQAPTRVEALATATAEAPPLRFNWTLWALMVVHQTHYFVYAYAVIYLAFSLSGASAVIAALAFALGWVTYLSAERLWSRIPDRSVFVAGHLFLCACLVGMAWAGESWTAVVLWVLTGFGGGSVYCLVSISAKAGLPEASVERAEDVGHVAGLALAIALVALGGLGPTGLALVGAVLAAIAAITMVAIGKGATTDATRLIQRTEG